ncbi:MAG: hypothetical protein FJZ00_08515 [Candidatus Sericytochromatia bacterium]|uniref:Uncharacterized protein n=1 Tax=Candidatus Tanganyikabacteria bacterium TaxID=2961651 RepID=A0A937X3C0_9BACT|nr:hypothetical protein [Candidatus Tanganyikabacteria bacterium]
MDARGTDLEVALQVCLGRWPSENHRVVVKDMWCIPKVDGEYVARMEGVLIEKARKKLGRAYPKAIMEPQIAAVA